MDHCAVAHFSVLHSTSMHLTENVTNISGVIYFPDARSTSIASFESLASSNIDLLVHYVASWRVDHLAL